MSKLLLGGLIERVKRRNTDLTYGYDDVRGISNNKEIALTKADIESRTFEKFQIVMPCEFVFNRRTTRMGDKLGLAYNNTNRNFIFTEDYVVFRVSETGRKKLLSDYLNIFFRRSEFDRLVRYSSWGSSTEFFNWQDMSDIEIDLPSIAEQEKTVAVYNAMKANQAEYERGLDDLKMVCDAYIENLRRVTLSARIKEHIEQVDEMNTRGQVELSQGISVEKVFTDAKRESSNSEKRKIVRDGCFAYRSVLDKLESGFTIALRTGEPCTVSPAYTTFKTKKTLLPEYLMMWLSRSETERFLCYLSFGSARATFSFSDLEELEFPIPSIEIQQAIVDIYNAYMMRRDINERLKAQIKDLCPILIKGSLQGVDVA